MRRCCRCWPCRPGSLLAQDFSPQTADGQIERSRLPNPVLPLAPGSLSLGEPPEASNSTEQPLAPATAGDSDLGVQSLLRAHEQPRPWSIFADGGFVYTTNVALTKRNTEDDIFAVSEVGVGYERQLHDNLTLSASVREQYFAYNRFNQLDFGALNVALGLTYSLPQTFLGGGVVVSTQAGYTRLTARGFDNEFYRSGTLSFGLQKVFTIGRAQILSVGGDSSC